jgi:alpha-beta hydrolase superfamily lysophospholipase
MNKTLACLIVAVSCFAVPVVYSSQEASERQDVRQLGQAFIDLLAQGRYREAAGSFDETMTKLVPPAKLEQLWASLAATNGAFRERVGARRDRVGEYERAFVTCRFERTDLDLLVVFDRAGRVTGLFVQPAYTAPAYADARLFQQREVSIGAGASPLSGILTVPVNCSRCPGIVLVHGSGPNDRDESLGPNKPFRDLALGLASRGIAVLQYDKRTYAYPREMAALKTLTVKQEVIDDAVAAVGLLRKTQGVAADRVFLLGHSLGAAVAPRIAAEDSAIAGLILLAGPTRALEDSLIEQEEYLASLNGRPTEQQKTHLDKVQAQVERVKNLKDSDEMSNEMVLAAPASYWLDLRRNPVTDMARTLKQPMLILQGERDYQVTMADFKGWQAALASKRNATFKSYPALNHLFLEGTGRATPAEYERPGHVAQAVIDDVAAWIKAR